MFRAAGFSLREFSLGEGLGIANDSVYKNENCSSPRDAPILVDRPLPRRHDPINSVPERSNSYLLLVRTGLHIAGTQLRHRKGVRIPPERTQHEGYIRDID